MWTANSPSAQIACMSGPTHWPGGQGDRTPPARLDDSSSSDDSDTESVGEPVRIPSRGALATDPHPREDEDGVPHCAQFASPETIMRARGPQANRDWGGRLRDPPLEDAGGVPHCAQFASPEAIMRARGLQGNRDRGGGLCTRPPLQDGVNRAPTPPTNAPVQGEAPGASASQSGPGKGASRGTPPQVEADYAPTLPGPQDSVSTKDFVQEEAYLEPPAQDLPSETPAEGDPCRTERTEPGTTPASGTPSPSPDDIPDEPALAQGGGGKPAVHIVPADTACVDSNKVVHGPSQVHGNVYLNLANLQAFAMNDDQVVHVLQADREMGEENDPDNQAKCLGGPPQVHDDVCCEDLANLHAPSMNDAQVTHVLQAEREMGEEINLDNQSKCLGNKLDGAERPDDENYGPTLLYNASGYDSGRRPPPAALHGPSEQGITQLQADTRVFFSTIDKRFNLLVLQVARLSWEPKDCCLPLISQLANQPASHIDLVDRFNHDAAAKCSFKLRDENPKALMRSKRTKWANGIRDLIARVRSRLIKSYA